MIGWVRNPPRLAVHCRGPAPPGLVTLLALTRRWCTIVVLTDAAETAESRHVDAVLAIGTDPVPTGCLPVALWVESVGDLEREMAARADVVLSASEDVVGRAGSRALLVPAGMLGTRGWPPDATPTDAVPVAPFVRARLRRARGLPDPLVIEHDGERWAWNGPRHHLDADLGVTAVGCASAAVVTGPPLIGALAWGTPCVTDVETAVRFRVVADRDVLVADSVEARRRAAIEVATDAPLAARLSWAGRLLVETRHSPAMVAAALVRRLGLSAASRVPVPPPLAAALAQLGTPESAAVVERVRLAAAILEGARD